MLRRSGANPSHIRIPGPLTIISFFFFFFLKKKEIPKKKLTTAAERHRISAHPDVNFTVVINPGNGPGPDALPDANYTSEVPKLASFENVRLLGYVYTSYGKRNVSAIRKDIQTYADWPTNSSNPNLAVRGIFFDETPQQYDAQTFSYLEGLTDFVKDLKGLGPDPFVSAISFQTLFLLYLTIIHWFIPHTPVLPHLDQTILYLCFFIMSYPFLFAFHSPLGSLRPSCFQNQIIAIDFDLNTAYYMLNMHHIGFPL